MDRKPRQSLEGKVVMVTGASSGIGLEICLDLAAAGCKIVAAARRLQRLRSLCDEINGSSSAATAPVRAVAVELDVSVESSAIEAAVTQAWAAFGRIDALVNNAGVRGIFKSEITEKLFEKEGLSNAVKRAVPLRTLGTVNPALTSVVRYLIDEASEYVSGNAFIVDAGTTLPGVPIFPSL